MDGPSALRVGSPSFYATMAVFSCYALCKVNPVCACKCFSHRQLHIRAGGQHFCMSHHLLSATEGLIADQLSADLSVGVAWKIAASL